VETPRKCGHLFDAGGGGGGYAVAQMVEALRQGFNSQWGH